jgi:hypothetical protein
MQQDQTAWDAFFDKCATDPTYREQLAEALRAKDDGTVIKLLEREGFKGGDPKTRVDALRKVYAPMLELARAFGAPHEFVAP